MNVESQSLKGDKPNGIREFAGNLFLFRHSEGYIFVSGLALCTLVILWLGVGAFWLPEYHSKTSSLLGARMVLGRPGGVYAGYVLGVGHLTNCVINMLVDTIGVLLFYPLIAMGNQRFTFIKMFKKALDRISSSAESKIEGIRHFGGMGLFIFVLFPLWGTGPVVGSAVGILLGLKPGVNMSIVLGATYLAIGIWMIFLSTFYDKTLAYSSSSPMVIVSTLLFMMVVIYVFKLVKGKS